MLLSGLMRHVTTLFYCLITVPIYAQAAPAPIVVSPALPTTATPIRIDVPVDVCFHSDPLSLVSDSSINTVSNMFEISVDLDSFACFATGDPVVTKYITFTHAPLPAGQYTIHYQRSENHVMDFQQSTEFAIIVTTQPANVPILSAGYLALLAILLGFAAAYLRPRHH